MRTVWLPTFFPAEVKRLPSLLLSRPLRSSRLTGALKYCVVAQVLIPFNRAFFVRASPLTADAVPVRKETDSTELIIKDAARARYFLHILFPQHPVNLLCLRIKN